MSDREEVLQLAVRAPVRAPGRRPDRRYVTGAGNGQSPYRMTQAGYVLVAEMLAEGASYASVAAALRMDTKTFTEMRKRDDTLSEACARGYGVLEDEVVGSLVGAMRGGHVGAAIFLAKGRLGMREVGPDANTPTAVQVNITIPAPLPAEEVLKIIGPIPPREGEA